MAANWASRRQPPSELGIGYQADVKIRSVKFIILSCEFAPARPRDATHAGLEIPAVATPEKTSSKVCVAGESRVQAYRLRSLPETAADAGRRDDE